MLVSAVASIVAWIYVGSPWHVSLGALVGIVLAAAMPVRDGDAADAQAPDRGEAGE